MKIGWTIYPERLLYPLKRVGRRGDRRWLRVSWDAALGEIADKMLPLRENGTLERFVFHYGRDKTKGYTKRFTNAFETPQPTVYLQLEPARTADELLWARI